jgi:hypothetical protein
MIEIDEHLDTHEEYFRDYRKAGYKVDLQEIPMAGKLYDFSFHNDLDEAQSFCRNLGYELDQYSGLNGVWAGKLFRIV